MPDNKKLVLVVDDQEIFLQAVIDELVFLDYVTISAKDGLEAFKIASTTKLDLIISDIRMPNKDGQWFLTELRKTHKTSPPFVFMTGFADLTIQDAYSIGVDAFLGKPLNPEKLETILTKLCLPLEKRLSNASLEKPIYNIHKKLDGALNDLTLEKINFGRGGVYLAFEKLSFQVGDCVSFDFEFSRGQIKRLNGVGSIVWKKENPNGMIDEYGLYFDFISQPCLNSWLEYLKTHEMTQVIPKNNQIRETA